MFQCLKNIKYVFDMYVFNLKKKANNLDKIIFIIGGERRKSFYRVLKKTGEAGLVRKKKEKERVLSHQHGTHGFQNIYSSTIASIV